MRAAPRPSRRAELARWAVQRAGWRRAGALGALGAGIAGVVTLANIGAFDAPAPPVVLWKSIQAASGGALGGLAYAALAEQLLASARWRRWVAGGVVGLAFLAGMIALPLWRFGHVPWTVLWCGASASTLLGLCLVPPQRAVTESADAPGA